MGYFKTHLTPKETISLFLRSYNYFWTTYFDTLFHTLSHLHWIYGGWGYCWYWCMLHIWYILSVDNTVFRQLNNWIIYSIKKVGLYTKKDAFLHPFRTNSPPATMARIPPIIKIAHFPLDNISPSSSSATRCFKAYLTVHIINPANRTNKTGLFCW